MSLTVGIPPTGPASGLRGVRWKGACLHCPLDLLGKGSKKIKLNSAVSDA